MKLSTREKVLIYLMVLLALITGVYFFVFQPVAKAYDSALSSLEEAENRESTLAITKLQLQNTNSSIASLSDDINTLLAQLHAYGDNDQLDTEVIKLLWKYSLTPIASSIEPAAPSALAYFGAAAQADAAGTDAAAADTAASSSYVLTSRISVQFRGTRENFASLLTELSTMKGVRASDFSFADASDTAAAADTADTAAVVYPEGYVAPEAAAVRPGEGSQDISLTLDFYMKAPQ